MPRTSIVLLVTAAMFAAPAHALETVALDASVVGGIYRVRLDAVLDAPVDRVSCVLTDYLRYAELDPRIRSSEIVGTAPDGATLLRTRIRACAAFFCRDIKRVERVTIEDGLLVAVALPEHSDVRNSVARTEWRAEGNRTRIVYAAEFIPDFWVPTVIARGPAGRMLRESVLAVFANLEAQAREP